MKILRKKCCKKSVRGDFHFQTGRKLAIFRKLIDFLDDQKNSMVVFTIKRSRGEPSSIFTRRHSNYLVQIVQRKREVSIMMCRRKVLPDRDLEKLWGGMAVLLSFQSWATCTTKSWSSLLSRFICSKSRNMFKVFSYLY